MTSCPRCGSDQFYHIVLIEEISQFSIGTDGEIEDEDTEISDILEDSFRCSHCGYTTSSVEEENNAEDQSAVIPQKIRARLAQRG